MNESCLTFYFLFLLIGPSYTNFCAPRRALNEGDLPPREGAQPGHLTFARKLWWVPLHFDWLVEYCV